MVAAFYHIPPMNVYNNNFNVPAALSSFWRRILPRLFSFSTLVEVLLWGLLFHLISICLPRLKRVRQALARRNPTSASINRLPVEVLGEIFMLYALNGTPHFQGQPMAVLGATPLHKATRVCSHWRSVALSMPLLWSSIAIHFPGQNSHRYLELWLERGESCPLSVEISASQRAYKTAIRPFLFVVLQHSVRLVRFSITLPDAPSSIVDQISRVSFPQLMFADLKITDWRYSHLHELWRIIHDCPSLRGFSNWTPPALVSTQYPASLHIPPWQQLLQLRLDNVPIDKILECLQHCTNLEVLDIRALTQKQVIVFRPCLELRLRRLSVRYSDDLSYFFDSLLLPDLEHLSFERLPYSALDSLSDLLDRSSCRVTFLNLEDRACLEETVIQFLSIPAFASLTSLRLFLLTVEELMVALTAHDDQCLLPRLDCLHVDNAFWPSQCEWLATMVVSRTAMSDESKKWGNANHVQKLKSVTFYVLQDYTTQCYRFSYRHFTI